MPTVDYKPLANAVAANVETQAQFVTDLSPGGSLEFGYKTGLANSPQFNKVARQSSMMTAAMATFISNVLNIDVLDDGVLATLITNLTNAIQASAWTTGDAKGTYKNVADPGWVMMNDGTIGDATSGASTRANADCLALFTLMWNNVTDTWAPVVGGRGGSAAADWAAHKKLTLPKALGRALAVAGAGTGLTARVLGQNLGEEGHVQLLSELVPHHHSDNEPTGGGNGYTNTTNFGSTTQATVTGDTGGGAPMNVMQPSSFLNVMVRL